MKEILAVVEGQTEEQFINEVLAPELRKDGIYITPKIIVTKIVAGGPNKKGGITDYGKIRRDILNCLKSKNVSVTTFIDYYGLPNDFPGNKNLSFGSTDERITHLETKMAENINNSRFVPYIQKHEFEALLFSKKDGFEYFYPGNISIISEIERIIEEFPNPEDINDNPETAPSKRIKEILPNFDKVIQGNMIALENGIDSMISSCPHFRDWIDKLKSI